jgi:hypothetical protein
LVYIYLYFIGISGSRKLGFVAMTDFLEFESEIVYLFLKNVSIYELNAIDRDV